MKKRVNNLDDPHCMILMPVGPNSKLHHIRDTIESINYFSDDDTVLVILDDTAEGLHLQNFHSGREIDLFRAGKNDGYSVRGSLYINLSKAIKYIVEKYNFYTLLRMDDDALFIGAGAEPAALQFFRDNPEIGCIGSFRYNSLGLKRDFGPVARRLAFETSIAGGILNPVLAHKLREIRRLAVQNGYETGEHCLGAACFYSRAAIVALVEQGLLDCKELRTTRLCDDQLFGMLLVAAGFHAADFSGAGQPLGLAWQGLPASPQKLVDLNKKIVHSVKSYKDASQDEIRQTFAGFRKRSVALVDTPEG